MYAKYFIFVTAMSLPNQNGFAQWSASEHMQQISTLEMHTGGEPLRIITAGFPNLTGDTILAKRQDCLTNYDDLRKGLMFEPRGHADMYGAIIVEPERADSDLGVLFIHNEGYSTMCGHAIIALSKAAIEAGVVPKQEGKNEIRFDVPCGQICSEVTVEQGEVTDIRFNNVPSFLALKEQSVFVEGIGDVSFDLGYGGAFYAYVDADSIDLSLSADNANQIIDWGKRIKHAVIANTDIKHPFEQDLSFLYGTIFVSKTQVEHANSHSRNVCIFAEGELDRSPTGSGVAGRAAIHFAKGELAKDEVITIESILGSQFSVKVMESLTYGEYQAVIPQVSGSAHIVGKNTYYFDKRDPLNTGFIFR